MYMYMCIHVHVNVVVSRQQALWDGERTHYDKGKVVNITFFPKICYNIQGIQVNTCTMYGLHVLYRQHYIAMDMALGHLFGHACVRCASLKHSGSSPTRDCNSVDTLCIYKATALYCSITVLQSSSAAHFWPLLACAGAVAF